MSAPKQGCNRRAFCAAASAGLVVLGLPGCDPGDPRLGTGAIEDPGGVGGGGPGPGPATDGGTPVDGHDMATGSSSSKDMASSSGNPDLASAPACKTGLVNAGAASSFTLNTAKHLANGGNDLLVVKDAGGFYAMTALCPHQGCVVKQQSSQLYCPCHSAKFDMNGEHPTSPVFQPLDHYAVCVDSAGTVWVDDNTAVAATARTPA